VTAESGRLGTPPLVAIADTTGGIVIRLPDGATPPGRGTLVRVTGPLADPYGQLEIRPAAGGLRATGTGALAAPLAIGVPELGEGTEGSLVQLRGILHAAPTKGTSGDLVMDLVDGSGRTFRVAADGSSGIRTTDLPRDQLLRVVGIVGQHASRKGALDGYRLWLRDRADVAIVASGGGGASPTPSPGASAGSTSAAVSIAAALRAPDGTALLVEGTVTAGVSLLDTSHRRIVIQDASGAIEVLLPADATPPDVGSQLRVGGEKAHAWGAPRLRATSVDNLPMRSIVVPAPRAATLGERDEWRLVRVSGTVLDVQRMGDRWKAELRLPNGDRIPILGQAGAGIASTAIVEGRAATIVGIVRRAYPTATDRRFALLPRSRGDVAIGPAAGSGGPGGSGATGASGARSGSGAAGSGAGPSGQDSGDVARDVTPDTDLATLFEHIGQRVHVGGLLTELTTDGFLLDDGTAIARVILHGDALILLPNLRVGEALAARGTVEQVGEALRISVASAGDLVRVGDLGQALPVAGGSAEPSASEDPLHRASFAGAGGLDLIPAEVSLLTFGGVTLLSVVITMLRRRAAARRSRVIVLARLATLTSRHKP
jgi:hypothetical protein